jgi:hypothetical protein
MSERYWVWRERGSSFRSGMIDQNLWKVTVGTVLKAPVGPAKKLVRNPVAARLTAGRAIIEPITAQTNVDLSLAGAAVLFAIALVFCHVALHALILGLGDGGHKRTLARVEGSWKVPLVTARDAPEVRIRPKVRCSTV